MFTIPYGSDITKEAVPQAAEEILRIFEAGPPLPDGEYDVPVTQSCTPVQCVVSTKRSDKMD